MHFRHMLNHAKISEVIGKYRVNWLEFVGPPFLSVVFRLFADAAKMTRKKRHLDFVRVLC